MIEKIIYIADDGKEFEDENECYDYETELAFKNTIENNDLILLTDGFVRTGDLGSAQYVICKTEESVDYLFRLNEPCGYCAYDDIDEPGVYYYEDDTFKDWKAHYERETTINTNICKFIENELTNNQS